MGLPGNVKKATDFDLLTDDIIAEKDDFAEDLCNQQN